MTEQTSMMTQTAIQMVIKAALLPELHTGTKDENTINLGNYISGGIIDLIREVEKTDEEALHLCKKTMQGTSVYRRLKEEEDSSAQATAMVLDSCRQFIRDAAPKERIPFVEIMAALVSFYIFKCVWEENYEEN